MPRESIKYLTHFTYFCSFHITSRLRGAKRTVIWVSIYVNRKKEKEKKELTQQDPAESLLDCWLLKVLLILGQIMTSWAVKSSSCISAPTYIWRHRAGGRELLTAGAWSKLAPTNAMTDRLNENTSSSAASLSYFSTFTAQAPLPLLS